MKGNDIPKKSSKKKVRIIVISVLAGLLLVTAGVLYGMMKVGEMMMDEFLDSMLDASLEDVLSTPDSEFTPNANPDDNNISMENSSLQNDKQTSLPPSLPEEDYTDASDALNVGGEENLSQSGHTSVQPGDTINENQTHPNGTSDLSETPNSTVPSTVPSAAPSDLPSKEVVTTDKIAEIKDSVSASDKIAATALVASKLSSSDISYLSSLMQGGLTAEDKAAAKALCYERFNAEDIAKIKALYKKYMP